MENFEKMKTEEFLNEVLSLGLIDEFTDYMAELDEEYAEGENVVRKPLRDKIDTRQESDNRLCDYLNEYIGPRVPISEQDFLIATKRIRSLREDINAVSVTLDKWGMETYDIWEEVLWKTESCPLEEWVERIVEHVLASQRKAA
jgi:hypothetical protein